MSTYCGIPTCYVEGTHAHTTTGGTDNPIPSETPPPDQSGPHASFANRLQAAREAATGDPANWYRVASDRSLITPNPVSSVALGGFNDPTNTALAHLLATNAEKLECLIRACEQIDQGPIVNVPTKARIHAALADLNRPEDQ